MIGSFGRSLMTVGLVTALLMGSALAQPRKVLLPLVVEDGEVSLFEEARVGVAGVIRLARLQTEPGGGETATVTLSAWNGDDRGLMPLHVASVEVTTGTTTLSPLEGRWLAGETRVGLTLDGAADGDRGFLLLLIMD